MEIKNADSWGYVVCSPLGLWSFGAAVVALVLVITFYPDGDEE